LLIDLHNDWPLQFRRVAEGKKPDTSHTGAARLRAGGVNAVFLAAYVPAQYAKTKGAAARYAQEQIDLIRERIVPQNPGAFVFARTASEIEAARTEGKIAVSIGIEGGHAIEDSLERLRAFYASGVRYMTLTHSNTNGWADSSGDAGKPGGNRHGGLSPHGEKVVREMNRLGMMVDISHVSDETFWDVMRVTTAPVIASHSSCRALTNHSRNMTDEMIRAVGKNGGVVHINFACDFINEDIRKASKAQKKKMRATIDDVVAHIDHAVKLAGDEAVGIGSDFDGIDCAPLGLEDVSKFPNLTRVLLERGYTAEQIARIYGGNTLRVMRAVERQAGK
jgi:membrane dipeptidase